MLPVFTFCEGVEYLVHLVFLFGRQAERLDES